MPLGSRKTDTSRDGELVAALQEELAGLEQRGNLPNTLERGRIVASHLNGEGTTRNIGDLHGIWDSTVSRLAQTYRDGGIGALKEMEHRPLRKRKADTSRDGELAAALQEELAELELQGSLPHTLERGRIVASYLNGEGTRQKIGDLHGISGSAVSRLVLTYRDGGIEALKAKEPAPLRKRKVDTSKDEELATALQNELDALERQGSLPNTLERGRIVASYLNGEGTTEEIGDHNGISGWAVSNLSLTYRDGGIEALKEMEHRPLGKRKADTSKDGELATALQEELAELELQGSLPNTLKRGRAVASYLNGEGTAEEIGGHHGISERAVSRLVLTYRDGGIEALKAKEPAPLRKRKVDTSKDEELATALQNELDALERQGSLPNTLERGRIVASYLNGEGTTKEIGSLHGISDSTVSRLAQTYRDGGIGALMAKEYRPLGKRKADPTKIAARRTGQRSNSDSPEDYTAFLIPYNFDKGQDSSSKKLKPDTGQKKPSKRRQP